jgi:hypothetical protein
MLLCFTPKYLIVFYNIYKPEDGRFDSQLGRWIFQFTKFFQPHYDPGVNWASNRNECQESSWG